MIFRGNRCSYWNHTSISSHDIGNWGTGWAYIRPQQKFGLRAHNWVASVLPPRGWCNFLCSMKKTLRKYFWRTNWFRSLDLCLNRMLDFVRSGHRITVVPPEPPPPFTWCNCLLLMSLGSRCCWWDRLQAPRGEAAKGCGHPTIWRCFLLRFYFYWSNEKWWASFGEVRCWHNKNVWGNTRLLSSRSKDFIILLMEEILDHLRWKEPCK